MSEWLKKLSAAVTTVQEAKKMDPVNKKALKKDFDDREDKDIDNDGDVDSSDKYLHNRRKTISKATKGKETETQVDEALEENKNLLKDYQAMKAQGKKDHNIIDALMSMPKYKRMSRDQMAKVIGDARRKGVFKEEAKLDEAAIAPATHKGYQDPMDKGLSPSAKDELGRTTDAPSDAFDANKVIAKTFKDMRASLKNKKMRKGDQDTGDKAPVKNDGK